MYLEDIDLIRRIIHVDMDAFYASVEQRDRPELRGLPIVVGGNPDGRGVVATCSYEARAFGIRSAMPCSQAKRLCPNVVFVQTNMAKYKEASRQIRDVFHEVTDLVEPLSLDEAYLDVTENKLNLQYGRDVAKYIKARIFESTRLTASAGVAPNKFVAKVASDLRKPDGLVIIPPEQVADFIAQLPVRKIWGVGPATAKRLELLGIRTGLELRNFPPDRLQAHLGRTGRLLHRLAHGDDPRRVTPNRVAKSRGSETTLDQDVIHIETIERIIQDQARQVAASLLNIKRPGKTVTLKLRYSDFETITRSRTLPSATSSSELIAETACHLLRTSTHAGERPVRLVGVSVSGLLGADDPEQLWLALPLP